MSHSHTTQIVSELKSSAIQTDIFRSDHGITLLIKAITERQIDEVRKLVREGVNACQVSKVTKLSCFHFAAFKGYTEAVRLFVETYGKKSIELPDSYEDNALSHAARSGDLETFKYLLNQYQTTKEKISALSIINKENCIIPYWLVDSDSLHILQWLDTTLTDSLDIQDPNGSTCLFYSAAKGNHEIFEYLAGRYDSHPKYFHATLNNKNTLLHLACQSIAYEPKESEYGMEDDSEKMIRYLIEEKKLDPTTKNDKDENSLMIAARKGSARTVQYLLKHKKFSIDDLAYHTCENAHATNNQGMNALHIAAQDGSLNILKLLIQHGFNPLIKSRDSKTALYYFKQSGEPPADYAELRNIFIEKLAIEDQHDQVEKLLDEAKAEPKDYPFFIHFAIEHGSIKTVKMLLRRGWDPNILNSKKMCCAKIAISKGHLALLKAMTHKLNISNDQLEKLIGFAETTRTILKDAEKISEINKIISHLKKIKNKKTVELKSTPSESKQELPKKKHKNKKKKIKTQSEDQKEDESEQTTPIAEYEKTSDETSTEEEGEENDTGYAPVETAVGTTNFFSALSLDPDQGRKTSAKKITAPVMLQPESTPALQEFKEKKRPDSIKPQQSPLEQMKTAITQKDNELICALANSLETTPSPTEKSNLLNFAIQEKQLETIKFLTHFFKISATFADEEKNTPLQMAASTGDLATVKYLTNSLTAPKNCLQKNKDGKTALHLAAQHGHFAVVKHLIEEKFIIPVDTRDNAGHFCLHDVASGDTQLAMKEYLEHLLQPIELENRLNQYLLADSKQDDISAFDAIKMAIQIKRADMFAHLSADMNSYEPSRKSLLLNIAIDCRSIDTMRIIAESFPEIITQPSPDGVTPLEYAVQKGYTAGLTALMWILINTGQLLEEVMTARYQGQSLLEIAANFGQIDVVKIFIEKGYFTVDQQKMDIEASLISAQKNNHDLVAHYLENQLKMPIKEEKSTASQPADKIAVSHSSATLFQAAPVQQPPESKLVSTSTAVSASHSNGSHNAKLVRAMRFGQKR